MKEIVRRERATVVSENPLAEGRWVAALALLTKKDVGCMQGPASRLTSQMGGSGPIAGLGVACCSQNPGSTDHEARMQRLVGFRGKKTKQNK